MSLDKAAPAPAFNVAIQVLATFTYMKDTTSPSNYSNIGDSSLVILRNVDASNPITLTDDSRTFSDSGAKSTSLAPGGILIMTSGKGDNIWHRLF